MGGTDKLLRPVKGVAMLCQAALAALASNADQVFVVIAPERSDRNHALAGLDVRLIPCVDWQGGLSASLRVGVAALPAEFDAVIVALSDMPEVSADHYNRLIAAYAPKTGRLICRALGQSGRAGNPVLFDKRFFGSLQTLQGDTGARDLIRDNQQCLADVPTMGEGALIDLDTPEDWQNWLAKD